MHEAYRVKINKGRWCKPTAFYFLISKKMAKQENKSKYEPLKLSKFVITCKKNQKRRASIILPIAIFFSKALSFLSLPNWANKYYDSKDMEPPLLIPEVWVMCLIIIEVIVLSFFKNFYLLLGVVVYCLSDVIGATLRDIVYAPQIHRDNEGGYILIRDRIRWLLMVPLNLFQVVISFALLFLCYGDQFEPNINSPITALYQSSLTFTTLGYGDIKPICETGQIIAILELGCFLLFAAMKLPIAISVIRVKEKPRN